MRRHRRLSLSRRLLLLSLLLPGLARAGVQLVVDGVDDRLKAAVTSGLELSQYAARDVSDAQIRRLYARAPDQAKAALEPYGYYDATVESDLQQVGRDWRVTLHVKPGEPVRITSVDVRLDADALALPAVRRAERAIERLKGQPLDHGAYEAARDGLARQLTANGFLDARLVTRRVEVNRGNRSAEVRLAWQAGRRFRFGRVHFEGSQFRPGFLDRYVPFKRGDYFLQDDLLQLQQALTGADYFAVVNVLPEVDEARDGVVDVKVELAPARRSIYTGGPFIGTDTGFGVRGGLERRWVNDRGHKWKNEIVLAQRLKMVSSLYSIPMPGDDQRSFNFGANYRAANTDTSDSHTLELVANETRLWHGWTRTLGLHALSGTFTVGKKGGEPDNTLGIEHGRSTLLYAEASLARKQADNPSFVRKGWSINVTARSTAGTLLSDARFSQLLADAKWIHALGRRDRLILRGSAGMTWTSDFGALPPQLRFFAGGDRSVRGYSYQSIGPRNSYDRVVGGRNLLVGSSEVEHYFTRNWGMAAFVDAGNAFDGTDYRPKIGAGLGVRWLSPVGMIRVDLGTPVHSKDEHGIQLHIVIGPDL
ncbi:autotransporter assembly complex protein TamA [Fulvimonas soli]|jgi:translocation and assembly module TamA|uniref:Translocation and assembly module subunit TamA n=1 Tax=Fulvimonas soli TaxID=155197 RepID=A0A316HWK7_9GAMM|nr:autotransporter assembly complex family protein [Fulvimonas soli]PWK84347.1 autotransporter secretion outer membrane protein TamA [Fulvimonas soli]TNY26504.1 outer membrane protein assembly factor [Fulvimonas soli]